MKRAAKRVSVAILFCFALFAAAISIFSNPVYAEFSLVDGIPNEADGYYYVTKAAVNVEQTIIFDGSADFNFQNGFYIEWESTSGPDGVHYEISFLKENGEGICIFQDGSAVCAEVNNTGGKNRTDIIALNVDKVNALLKPDGSSFILSINGEELIKIPGAGFTDMISAAVLKFCNRSDGDINSARLTAARPAGFYASPYLCVYDRFEKNDIKIHIDNNGAEDIIIYHMTNGDKSEIPESLYSLSFNKEKGKTEIILKAAIFSDAENARQQFVVVSGEYEHYFTSETIDSVNFALSENAEYRGVDLNIPLRSFGLTDIIIKQDNKQLIDAQGTITVDEVLLKADYLDTLEGKVHFNIYGKKQSGLGIEKTLTVEILEKSKPPIDNGNIDGGDNGGGDNELPVITEPPDGTEIPDAKIENGISNKKPVDISPAAITVLSVGGAAAVAVPAAAWLISRKKKAG